MGAGPVITPASATLLVPMHPPTTDPQGVKSLAKTVRLLSPPNYARETSDLSASGERDFVSWYDCGGSSSLPVLSAK